MFKYLFDGVVYEADTLEALQSLLVAAGYKGNVIKEYQMYADLQDSETEMLIDAQEQRDQDELEVLEASEDSEDSESENLQAYYDATEPVIK
jgi:hypothetical protein